MRKRKHQTTKSQFWLPSTSPHHKLQGLSPLLALFTCTDQGIVSDDVVGRDVRRNFEKIQ